MNHYKHWKLGKMKYTIIEYAISVVFIYLFFHYILKTVIILSIVISVVVLTIKEMSTRTISEESSMEQTSLSMEESPTIADIDLTDDTTPSIFINEYLLKKTIIAHFENKNDIFGKVYIIQDVTFVDDLQPKIINYDGFNSNYDNLVAFDLEEVRFDNHCFNNDGENLFNISCHRVGSGYIINSNVYLSMLQWHTIVELSDDILHCIVCDVYLEIFDFNEHIKTKGHSKQLHTYKPLRKFELSVTRKIGDIFHCGVCNVIYPVFEETSHNANNIHGDNLLTAINRASDFLNDSNEFSIGSDDFDYKSDDFDDKSDDYNEDHINGDVTPISLNENDYAKTISEKSTIEIDISKQSNVIYLTSNSVDASKTKSINSKLVDDHRLKIRSQNKTKTHNTFKHNKDKKRSDSITSDEISNHNDKFMDDYVQIMIKKTHFVIDMFAYNSIAFYGYTKYCFVCNITVYNDEVNDHVMNKLHTDNMMKHNFIDNYSKHLIRQNNFKYHCGICNIVINHPHLSHHIEWAAHKNISIQCKTKKSLRKHTKVINVATQKEDRISDKNAPKVKIPLHVQIVATPTQTTDDIENKKEIFNGKDLIIDFYNWNGLCKTENGFRCLICNENFTEGVELHCRDRHSDAVLNNIEEIYFPALIRKINNDNVHCISCNKLLLNDEDAITGHVNVKKHIRNHSNLMKD